MFYQRSQGPTESVAEYTAELHKLAVMSDFRNFLEDALHDRLVCRLANVSCQRRLLMERNLTLKAAIETATA